MFLWTHYGVMRGNNIRLAELADIFTVNLDQQGPLWCKAVVLSMRQGKIATAMVFTLKEKQIHTARSNMRAC